MATDNTEAEATPAAAPPKKKGGALKIVAIVVGAILLVGASLGGSYFIMQTMLNNQEQAQADAKSGKKEKKPKKPLPPPNYFAFDPPFVVNFEDESAVRFLQITVEVMTRDPLMVENLKTHMPKLRNDLVLLFGSVSYEDVRTLQGKEALRAKTLAAIQKAMQERVGKPAVEEVYFTSLVVQ